MKRDLLIYPYFLECSQYTDDSFWKGIFNDLAYGVTPYGTYIVKDFLTCNFKDREFVYKIQEKDSKELFNDITSIFRNKLSLMSREEIIRRKNDLYNDDNFNLSEDWISIKKKNIKEVMIEKYVMDMKKTYNLSMKQCNYLLSIIFLSFVFKVFGTSDVFIKEGKIVSIKGLEYSEGKILLKKNILNIQVNISPEIVISKKLMSDEWDRFLNALKK